MMKFITLLPLTDNDGKDQSTEVESAINDLAITFEGCTIEGPVEGRWMDNGKMYQDKSMRVSVGCDETRLEEARTMVIAIGHRLKQKAMYFEVTQENIEILRMD